MKGYDDMKNYPLEKYRYYFNGNRVIAVSTYGGKTVRGVAICHPEDSFNVELGKRLAAARCNEKIAIKRYARANRRLDEALKDVEKATEHMHNMADYRNDAFVAMNEASQAVDTLMSEVRKKI